MVLIREFLSHKLENKTFRWVPNNPEEIIEVPESQIQYYKKVYPLTEEGMCKNGCFIVIADAHTQVRPILSLLSFRLRYFYHSLPVADKHASTRIHQ